LDHLLQWPFPARRRCAFAEGDAGSQALVGWLAKLSRRKVIRHCQRTPFIGFQGNLLREHDVPRDEMMVRREAPAYSWQAAVV
jgi:hypothetical protein